MQLQGGNNPKNTASVDSEGRVGTSAVVVTEQQAAAVKGNTYNLNTGELTLTTDDETPVFLLENTGESRVVKVSRVFITALASTGGAGAFRVNIYYGATAGTILAAPVLPLYNFNTTSAQTLMANVRLGGTGVTFTPKGSPAPIRSLYPAAGVRSLTEFDHIVLPQGGAVLLTVTPPAGNTSMTVEAGLNAFLAET